MLSRREATTPVFGMQMSNTLSLQVAAVFEQEEYRQFTGSSDEKQERVVGLSESATLKMGR